MKNRLKLAAAVLTAVFALSGVTAFAQSSETATPTQTETVIEDNRTLTPKGNAQLVDDVSDNENLQFITVTARDGNVFYFVIDKGASSQNVYFLNTVDESDLAALVEDYTPTNTNTEQKPEASTSPEPEQTEQQQKQTEQKKGNSPMLYIVLALIAAGVIGGYYYKVILPKKKLEDADDIEDFELEETESEEISDEDMEDDE